MGLVDFFFHPRSRRFTVLGRRFELPVLDLRPLLAAADRRRRGVENPGLDGLLDVFRSARGRTSRRFRRAHTALDAQDAIVFAAMDHVGAYAGALTDAAAFIGDEARKKLRDLARSADERRRMTQGARLGERGEEALARDLDTVANHMRHIARTAALCLSRLGRYRRFVDGYASGLAEREASLATLRAGLVHDEQAWLWRERLEQDADLHAWSHEADAICGDIERMLEGLHGDLAGIEKELEAIPTTFARLISGDAMSALTGPDDALPLALPGLSDIPARLGDEDWHDVEVQTLEAELILDGKAPDELRSSAESWLETFEAALLTGRQTPPCTACGAPVASASLRGRAHVLCPGCRRKAADEIGRGRALDAVDVGGVWVATTPVTRERFDAVMGFVPERDVGREEAGLPVTRLTWLEAVAFCNALSGAEGRPEAYAVRGRRVKLRGEVGGWRLPTLAEWRAFTTTETQPGWWESPDRFAWHAGNSAGRLHPVATKKANPLGLFDTLGNAAEWLWEAPTAGRGNALATDERLAAGGGFVAGPSDLHPDDTLRLILEARDDAVGLRPVRDVPAPAPPALPAPRPSAEKARKAARPAKPARALASRPSRGGGMAAGSIFGGLVTAALVGTVVYHASGVHDPGEPPVVISAPPALPAPTAAPSAPSAQGGTAPAPAPKPPAPNAAPDDTARATAARLRAEALAKRGLAVNGPKTRGEALRHLREAIAADPSYPEAHVELARVLARMGRHTEAARALEGLSAITSEPDATRARELLEATSTDRDFRRLKAPHP